MAASPPVHTVVVEGHGVRLSGDLAGPVDGDPVVLLHGGGQTRGAWLSALRSLAASGYRALSLDLRGHGASEWPADGDYRVEAMVADLEAVIRTLPKPPVLVGASLGGITSLLTIAKAVEAGRLAPARALILVDVAPHIEKAGSDEVRNFLMKYLDGFDTVEQAAQAVATYNPHRRASGSTAGLMRNLRRGEGGRLFWHWDPRFVDSIPPAEIERTTHRLREAAAHVHVPVLLIRGQQSNIVSPESVNDLKARIPHAEVVDIAGAGHMVTGDRNDVFNDAVLGYLARLPRQAPTAAG